SGRVRSELALRKRPNDRRGLDLQPVPRWTSVGFSVRQPRERAVAPPICDAPRTSDLGERGKEGRHGHYGIPAAGISAAQRVAWRQSRFCDRDPPGVGVNVTRIWERRKERPFRRRDVTKQ